MAIFHRFTVRERTDYPLNKDMSLALEMAEGAAVEFIKILPKDYDNIHVFCRGSSGAILATLFYSALNREGIKSIHVNYVSKPDEKKHVKYENYFFLPVSYNDICILIDDFIDSGGTFKTLRDALPEKFKDNIFCLIAENVTHCKLRDRLEFFPKHVISSVDTFWMDDDEPEDTIKHLLKLLSH